MSVFISWGEKESLSHEGALLLQKWLPEVLPNLKSFVSSENIATGSLWLQELFKQLEISESGILCLTKETVERSWILFEAGALAKRLSGETGRVCPLLFEFKSLSHPLGAFQARTLDKNDEPGSKKEMLLLVKTLNSNRDEALRLDGDHLERYFDRAWTLFWNPYVQLCEKLAHTKKPPTAAKVTNEEILTEMRGAFRQFADVLTEIRRNSIIVPPLEQPGELQQLTIQCPFCQGGNEVLILDRAGETKPTICSNCGGRFNVHMNREHSVLVRGILPPASAPSPVIRTQLPTKAENVQCPTCQESLIIELPERAGETRSRFCPKCGNSVHIHRTMTGGVRIGGQFNGPNNDWAHFLNSTNAWVDSASLSAIVSVAIEVTAKVLEGAELTPTDLKKLLIERIGAEKLGINATTVTAFVKLLLFGGAFQFPPEAKGGWKTPFKNTLNQPLLIQAYARGVVYRLKAKFILTLSELPQLCELLFPPSTPGAEEAVKQALAESGKNQNQGLTEEENNR